MKEPTKAEIHAAAQAMGRKGGRATKQRHGPEFYHTIGKKGGDSTKERYGTPFFEMIGRKGGAKMKKLVAAGRKAGA